MGKLDKVDIPGLTPEQEERVRLLLTTAKHEAVEEYTRKAQWFRSWIREHDPLWAAQRFGTAGFIAGAALAYTIMRLMGRI